MITKFSNLFEKIEIEDIEIEIENEDEKLLDKIKKELSIITYKKKNSLKPIRIKKITGYFKKRDFKKHNLLYKTSINIYLSNNDIIKAKLSICNDKDDNNIIIKINDDVIFDINSSIYNDDIFIDKIIFKYKEHLLKTFKII